jgi:hypothetical protein
MRLLCAVVASRCRNRDAAAAADRPSAERIANIILMGCIVYLGVVFVKI